MNLQLRQRVEKLLALVEVPAPAPAQAARRIVTMERNVVLPAKAALIVILINSFYFTPWIGNVLGAVEVAVDLTQYIFGLYILANAAAAVVLFNLHRLPLAVVQSSVFTISLVDGIFLAAMTVVTLEFNSILYWLLFLILIFRNALSTPTLTSQLVLNTACCLCYLLAGVSHGYLVATMDEPLREALEVTGQSTIPTELFVQRIVLLWLVALGCYGVQVLLNRQRRTDEEAREFAVRESQLQSAGRVAAEFAHQIKNPLAIINNAAFSIQRALKDTKPETTQQVAIIQEEVAHADRIITQIMGYAQLSEGRVEKLSVTEELERVIREVFPPEVPTDIRVRRDLAESFPPLLMQRRHFAEAVGNLLLNARDALNGRGNIFLTARCQSDYSVEVSVRDDGPGIPPDKFERIFEAYYTTKERGTGLGLAVVKHNTELYGGRVQIESELGKGAKFTLLFPAKTLVKLGK
jgi:signal transduction histidine kinase